MFKSKKLTQSLRLVAAVGAIAFAALPAAAQNFQVANSTNGSQVAAAPINAIVNNLNVGISTAQNTANWGVTVGGNAQNTANWGVNLANNAQGTANAAWNYADAAYNTGVNAQNTANWAAQVGQNAQNTANWSANGVNAEYGYIIATSAASCAAAMGSPAWYSYCWNIALGQYPHP